MFKKVLLYASLLTVIVIVSASSIAQEQNDSFGLTVTPPTFELTANPGETITNSIRVENISSGALPVVAEKRNLTAVGEKGSVGLTEEETGFSMASWISVTPENNIIPQGEYRVYTYTITVPPNAEPGGHFGSIVFKTAAQENVDQTGTVVSQEIGSIILLRVAGEVEEKTHIGEFKPTQNLFEYGPVNFETRMVNDGNVHVKVGGAVTITDLFGREVGKVTIEPKNVLPGATRLLESSWDHKWLFGKYVATTAMYYGSGNQVLTATTTFWGLPYKLMTITLVIVLVLLLLFKKRKKRIAHALRILAGKEKI